MIQRRALIRPAPGESSSRAMIVGTASKLVAPSAHARRMRSSSKRRMQSTDPPATSVGSTCSGMLAKKGRNATVRSSGA